jgi:hypothetical protein
MGADRCVISGPFPTPETPLGYRSVACRQGSLFPEGPFEREKPTLVDRIELVRGVPTAAIWHCM